MGLKKRSVLIAFYSLNCKYNRMHQKISFCIFEHEKNYWLNVRVITS